MSESSGRIRSLEHIDYEISICQDCKHHENRTHTVPGSYPEKAFGEQIRVLFLGEGPSKFDDLTGDIFSNISGKELNRLNSEYLGLNRNQVFLLNTLKCHNRNNISKNRFEVYTCAYHTMRQIGIIKPHLVILLGYFPLFFGISLNKFNPHTKNKKPPPVKDVRQQVIKCKTMRVKDIEPHEYETIVTYHPLMSYKKKTLRVKVHEDYVFIADHMEKMRERCKK